MKVNLACLQQTLPFTLEEMKQSRGLIIVNWRIRGLEQM
jgi:hypothetical protein